MIARGAVRMFLRGLLTAFVVLVVLLLLPRLLLDTWAWTRGLPDPPRGPATEDQRRFLCALSPERAAMWLPHRYNDAERTVDRLARGFELQLWFSWRFSTDELARALGDARGFSHFESDAEGIAELDRFIEGSKGRRGTLASAARRWLACAPQ